MALSRSGIAIPLLVIALAALVPSTALAENIRYVGGKTVTIETLSLNPPPGWFKLDGTKGKNRDQHWFFFLNDGDRLDVENPSARVIVTPDRLAKDLTPSEFNRINKELAVKAGWKAASFEAGGQKRLIFRKYLEKGNKEAYYAPIPAKGRNYQIVFMVEGKGGKLPDHYFDFLLCPFEPAAAEDPVYPRDVGGKTVRLGEFLVDVPERWVRASSVMEDKEDMFMLLGAGYVSRGRMPIFKVARSPLAFPDAAGMEGHFERERDRIKRAGGKPERFETAGMETTALCDINRSDGRAEITFLPHRGTHVYPVALSDWKDESILPAGMLRNMARSLRFAEGPGVTAEAPESPPVKKTEQEPAPSAEGLMDAMGRVVTRPEIEASNVLYGGDIAVDTPEGRALKARHALILDALDGAFAKLDLAYDRLVTANDRFDQAYFELGGRVDARAANADWAAGAGKVRASLVKAMMLEKALHAGIEDLRARLAGAGGAPAGSRLAGFIRLRLLGLYSQIAELQNARVTGAMAHATALYHADHSPLPPKLKKELAQAVSEEESAIIAVLEADHAFRFALYASATGLTGLREIFITSLDQSITRLETDLAETKKRLAAWRPGPESAGEAELARDAVKIYEIQLEDFRRARKILREQAREGAGRLDDQAVLEETEKPILLASLGAVPIAGTLTTLAAAQSQADIAADRTARAYAQAVQERANPQTKEGYFSRAFRAVQNTVGAAANTVSMGSKMAADKYYGWRLGLSKKDSMDQVRETIHEHMKEYAQGEVGKKSMRQAIEGFESVEKGAESSAAGATEAIVGKGWLSWGAGKMANAAASSLTALGKGAMQTMAHDATPGERAEGLFNIITSVYGGSSNITGPLTQSAGAAGRNVVNQATRTAGTLIRSKMGIEAERSFIKTMGRGVIPSANRRILDYIRQSNGALESLKNSIIGNLRGFARSGLSPSAWKAAARENLATAFRQMGGRELAMEMIKKFSNESLLTGALDNWIGSVIKDTIDGLFAGAPGEPPVPGVQPGSPEEYILGLLQKAGLPPDGLFAPLAAIWSQAGQAACEAKIAQLAKTQGSFQGNMSGKGPGTGALSGTIQLTVQGKKVSGRVSGRSSTGDSFNGTISGGLDIWTGALTAKYSGTYHWVMGKSSGNKPISGPITGTFDGAGYAGSWSGAGKGSWSAK